MTATPPPRILFVGRYDWAALCNRIAAAINAYVGDRVARVVTECSHPFSYDEDMVVERGNLSELTDVAQRADWIISAGDGSYTLLEGCLQGLPLRSDVKRGTTHAGTVYRKNPSLYNALDDKLGMLARFMGCDSLHLAGGHPRALPYHGTCEPLSSLVPAARGRIVVSHSASNRAKKGSDLILPVLRRLEAAGLIEADLIEGVSAGEALRRRSRAHVHVDQMAPEVGGFGQAAIEAMGAGCVVMADMRNVGVDAASFIPRPPIIDVRDARELEDWLALLAREYDVLERIRETSLSWAQENASPLAVARYWLHHLARLGSKQDADRYTGDPAMQPMPAADHVCSDPAA